MIEVVGVSLKKGGKIYFFSPNGLELNNGDDVIVKTERGLQFGTIETPNTEIEESEVDIEIKDELTTTKATTTTKPTTTTTKPIITTNK